MFRTVTQRTSSLPTRKLGKTGVTLPILGFGTAHTGLRLSTREAVHLYETAFRAGVTYFDTAPEFAGYGKAQVQLSHFLKHVRSEVFLVTKCYEPDGERALRLLQQSLKELGTDYADLVFVHSVGADKMDPNIVFGKHGTYAALLKAKSIGLTRFVGLSGHSRPQRFLHALRQFEIDVLLNAVNFVDRHTYNFEEQVWPAAVQANIGLIAMKVYGGALNAKGTRALEVYDSAVVNRFLRTFGRHQRIITCQCERSNEPSLVQALHISNGDTILEKCAAKDGKVEAMFKSGLPDYRIIEDLYLSALSRYPTDNELTQMLALLNEAPADQRRAALEDVYWAVLSSRECLFNH